MANNILFIVLVVVAVLAFSGGLTGNAAYRLQIPRYAQSTLSAPAPVLTPFEQSQETKLASLQKQYSSLNGLVGEALQEATWSNIRLNKMQGLPLDTEGEDALGKNTGCECTCTKKESDDPNYDPRKGNAWGTVVCATEGNKCQMGNDQECQPICQGYCGQTGGSSVGTGKCVVAC